MIAVCFSMLLLHYLASFVSAVSADEEKGVFFFNVFFAFRKDYVFSVKSTFLVVSVFVFVTVLA